MEEAGERETAKPVACYALLSGCTRGLLTLFAGSPWLGNAIPANSVNRPQIGEISIDVVCTTTTDAMARDFHHAQARFQCSGVHPMAVFSDA
jgi:hypothetical protein